jgi:hypothetical protein
MNTENLNLFVEEFNKTKRNIGNFMKIALKYQIDIEQLGDPIETEKDFEWRITNVGSIFQCKDCHALELVENGKQRQHC